MQMLVINRCIFFFKPTTNKFPEHIKLQNIQEQKLLANISIKTFKKISINFAKEIFEQIIEKN